METTVVIDGSGNIVNRIVLADGSTWTAPTGFTTVVETTTPMQIGGTLIGGVYTPPVSTAPPVDPVPQTVNSQDIMAQFTVTDVTAIQAAIASNAQFWLLWSSFLAQGGPMTITNARFQQGWAALVQVLGQPRMTAIATALGVTIT